VPMGEDIKGFMYNVVDGLKTLFGGGDAEKIRPGNYTLELPVSIPSTARSSFEGAYVKVMYEAEFMIDIPAGRDFIFKSSFPLIGQEEEPTVEDNEISIHYPNPNDQGYFDKMFGPDVSIDLQLDSDVFRRGSTIEGSLSIKTRKGFSCQRIVEQLLRTEKTVAHKHNDTKKVAFGKQEFTGHKEILQNFSQGFSYTVPDDLVPACSGKNFDLFYELKIVLDIPWAKDPSILIPVLVI